MKNHSLTVDVYRGQIVESSHQVHCIVMDKDGQVIESWGDEQRMISPRSSLKLLQVLPFIESGALDALGLGGEEITLSCASHNAETVHIDKVRAWLSKIGLGADDLACGGHLSINEARAHEMIRNQEPMTGLLSDCSGKHAAMLSTAVHLEYEIKGYEDINHPVQQQIFKTISELAHYDLSNGLSGTDGCSVPNPAIPLKNLAFAFSHFMNPGRLDRNRALACQSILDAIATHPHLIAGAERFDTDVVKATNGNIISKIGAEGNYVVFIRDKAITMYLKAEDGVFRRATEPAIGFMLKRFGAIDGQMDEALSSYTRPILKNWKGIEIGKVVVR